jgi:hypothetical protein
MAKGKKGRRRKPRGRELPNHRWELFCNLFVFGNPKHDPKAPKDDRDNPPNPRNNGTIAYMAAGYKAGYRSAGELAYRLLKKVEISGRIAELKKEEQNIKAAFTHHWKTILPEAQEVLLSAMRGEAVTPQAVTSAKEIIEQALGPTRFRFGIDKGADTDGALNITLWSGRKE